MAAAAASANGNQNDYGGNKDWKTLACPHDFTSRVLKGL
jgi:hypothetical protein